MTRRLPKFALAAVAVLTGCSSGGGPGAKATAEPSGASTAPSSSAAPASIGPSPYRPAIEPARFTDQITNRYLPLRPGSTFTYDGTKDGEPWHDEVVVTREAKTVMGVRCVVVRDTVTSKGALVEKTTDWYAQDDRGNVWYFGEQTAEYTNGKVSNTKGSWEAGVGGAQPGIVMEAAPSVGDAYRQEYSAGEAEDVAKVLRLDAATSVPAGNYHDVLVTEDTNPFSPGEIEQKYYAPGVGFVYAVLTAGGNEQVKLTSMTAG